jgi:hypothetical protein
VQIRNILITINQSRKKQSLIIIINFCLLISIEVTEGDDIDRCSKWLAMLSSALDAYYYIPLVNYV